jgi:hypothetical protein
VTLRARAILLVAICAVALGGAIAYLFVSRDGRAVADPDGTTGVSTASLAAVETHARIVFRNMTPGASYGTVAMVPLDDPHGARVDTATPCERVYATSENLICLSSDRGFITTYGAHILDNNLHETQSLPFIGVPSRARLSLDGAYAATTSFTSSDSYASLSFSTRTYVTAVGGQTLGNLEDFTLIHDGRSIAPVDRNFWGVTFASDDDTFYATVRWSGHTWLVRGSLSQRRMVTLHEDAECPSLSPDGTQIVFKQRGDLPLGKWRLVDYDIASGTVTPLSETRSVDDQVEWLDETHVLYALARSGAQRSIDDVWSVPISGSGKPKLLIPEASSPAVVHQP